jgi:hypothetical protein
VTVDVPNRAAAAVPATAASRVWRRVRLPACVLGGYVALAFVVLANVWRHLPSQRLAIGGIDQYLFEWFLWHAPHSVAHGQDPLFTTLWNPPAGANLMANTSMLGVALPLAPLTLLFGPTATFAVALTIGLAGSAAAWYWLHRRLVPGSVLGAAVGGALCGFAPPFVSHPTAPTSTWSVPTSCRSSSPTWCGCVSRKGRCVTGSRSAC